MKKWQETKMTSAIKSKKKKTFQNLLQTFSSLVILMKSYLLANSTHFKVHYKTCIKNRHTDIVMKLLVHVKW